MSSRIVYLRLLSYLRPYWKAFLLMIVFMAIAGAAESAFPALMKELLDNGFAKAHEKRYWLIYPFAVLGIFLIRGVFSFFGDYLLNWVAIMVISDLRREMFDRVISLPNRYFADHLSGRLITRIVWDVNNVAQASTNALTSLIKDSVLLFGLITWLLYLDWQLTLITFIMIPFISVAIKYFSRRLRRVSHGLQESMGEIAQVVQESVEGYKIVKIFGGQNYEKERFQKAIQNQRRLQMRSASATSAQSPIVQFFATAAVALIVGIALYDATKDQGGVANFVSFITAMLMTFPPIKHLADVNPKIQTGLAAAESVFSLLDEESEIDNGIKTLGRATGQIEFDHVVFKYPGAESPALAGISFNIAPGECVALVGQSGGGKSTIANLLPCFYAIDEGQIRIDGQSLSEIHLASIRENIALVSQEVILFNDTIGANIAYGAMRNATHEEVVAAARAAYALEFIEQLPAGFDTMVGEHGVKLSGGQRQRLAIARALLKNAPILILDEATSALDSESERHVQAALEVLMKGRTTLVIAHRLSTIEKADRILVLAGGKIIESGSHQQLLSSDGHYARLQRMQGLPGQATTEAPTV
jgi:subfamily B ATP-binding cassette protein MsbA